MFGPTLEGREMCPLGCGANWHGLPREGDGIPKSKDCPGPGGVPVPVADLEPWSAA